jgi:stage II sporulation protein D
MVRRPPRLPSCALILAAALCGPAAARADVRFEGHGFGHGAGLAQWGAFGYASREGRDFRFILGHYFEGTRVTRVGGARVRVRLADGRAARVAGAALAVAANGRRVRLRAGRAYRFVPWVADGVRAIDLATGRTRAHLHAPVRLTGPAPLRLLDRAENGIEGGAYRGTFVLARDGVRVMVVDDAGLEEYLLGVVPGEVPAYWPAEALKAQAVAARSFARTSRRPGAPFDVFADTRSQVYRGVSAEAPATSAAVRATRRLAVTAGGIVAHTLFHSSSGGRTAAVEEAFGPPPVSYLRSAPDPYDVLSPFHDWTATFTESDIAQRLKPVLSGDFVAIRVVATTPSGRAGTVRVTGTLGTQDVPAARIRALLSLRSTWFTVAGTQARRT